ncbi:MAG: lysine--tRNA ligase, partial [Oscillospiraceae bacterium]|nr:lysine--tRNA ligase [Oscillospiraceae bacterium]
MAEERDVRIQKLEELKENGKNPYTNTKFPVLSDANTLKAEYEIFEKSDTDPENPLPKPETKIAGRITNWRAMGKAHFIDLQTANGRIQVYVKRDDINTEDNPDAFADFKKWDI